MNRYLAIVKARFLVLFQYRAAALAGLFTQIFWGLIYTMVFTAFYTENSAASPITLSQAIAFIWINQALLQLIPWNFDKEVLEEIRSGNVCYSLIRPLELYWFWFSKAIALRIVPTLLRSIPLIALASMFFGLEPPISWHAGALFLLSCIFSLLLSSALTTIVAITLFWTISGEGIIRLMPSVVILLSGVLVPLPLFPEWMQPFLSLQPFRAILDIPCRFYTGILATEQWLYYLLFQLMWAFFFILLGKYLLKRSLQKLVIQGG